MRLLSDQTIRVRDTVIAMVATGVVALLVYLGLLAAIHLLTVQRLQDDLTITARQTAALARAGRLGNPLVNGNPGLVQVQDDSGNVVASSRVIAGFPALRAPRRPPDDASLVQRICPGGEHCFTAVTTRVSSVRRPVTVYVVAPEPGLFPRPGLAVLLTLGIPVSIGLAGVTRWWSIGRRLAPIEGILAQLDEINAVDLRRRVPLPPRHDEFRWLAIAINATLDRLEAAVEQQRRFVSDVSHELRSPITGLRAELEDALLDPNADLRAALGTTLKHTERLQSIVTELLVLARRDAGLPGREERIDLGRLAEWEVRRRPRRVVAKVDAEPDVMVRANRLDLCRIFTNLLDNAARHAESEIVVTVRRHDGEAVAEVFNDGEEIAPQDRERIFERFTRLPSSRRRDSGGTGLGLAISRELATTYGGTLVAADAEGGARFVFTLPLLTEATDGGASAVHETIE